MFSFFIGIAAYLSLFFIIGLLGIIFTKNKGGLKIKSTVTVFIVLSVILLAVTTIMPISTKISRSSSGSSKADGFTIEKYDVTLDVDRDYKVNVTENILINFYESGHHGIYRTIPYWLEYTSKTGKTTSRKATISNVVTSENFTTEEVNGRKKIKIGNSSVTLSEGDYQYQINYTYDMNGDIYDGFDEFIFHAFGDYWGTRINNASLTIHMPDEVNKEDIRFFADKKRSKDITDEVDITVIGNTIYAKVSDTYKLKNALTIDIELPDGYFSNSKSEAYGYGSFIICMVCISAAVLSFVLWYFFGKDYDRVAETVEFYPPYNYDAAEIGFINKGETGRKLTIASILSLVSKGYVKLIEDKETLEVTLIKNTNLTLDEAIGREIKIIKLKDIGSGKDVTKEAKKFMKNFSSKVNETVISKDFDAKLEEIKQLIDNGYVKIEHDSLDDYKDEALKNIKADIEKKNKNVSSFTESEQLVFDALFEEESEVVLSSHKTLYKVFSKVDDVVEDKLDSLINDYKSRKATIISSIWLYVCIILWGFAYSFIKDMDPRFSFLYFLAYGANVATLVFTILMKRKTKYGEEVSAKVSGFKNYLEVAEKEQLEMLVKENPNYFFDILPYAYVLDVSSEWCEKFENIPMPENYYSGVDFSDFEAIDIISSSVYVPSSSGGGGGGGCSSCGGGCSSCGGGGSW